MTDFSAAPVTLFLLVANVLVSGYALFSDPGLIDRLAFKPRRILDGKEYYRLITGGFVHVGLGHLAFNMITLYFFGPYLEVLLGSVRFLLIYFGAELAAHGLSLWMHRGHPQYAAVGASGAISGIVFAYCLFNPFSQIGLFFAIWIPAWAFAVGFVVLSIVAMGRRAPGETGGLAHEAHLGGAVGGLLLTILLEPRALPIFLSQLGV
ncbi:rhomboid family intramembrane serine protease [Rhodocaloribacter litoris]|uniref:rhomboid family intramembrane serine protease n=1 Tax=Rhodocaloribacter litoris TaxID=2558931 RepID=UPI00141DDB66|nr:rhomboid family intramembrane serine protease [Rhodocaloribacter litoris]QXD14080.1 rhomboid family intramembrane serine protease [Rhodocaloribacter litoris]